MLKDFEQYDKLKIETIVRQRREASKGGHRHDPRNFFDSLCGMTKAFFRESVQHEYEDIAGVSKILRQRILNTVCKEADMIAKDIDSINLYVLLVHYILNDITNNLVVDDEDIISYDGYFLGRIRRNTTDSDIVGISELYLERNETYKKYENKSLWDLRNKLHHIILTWMSKYKEVEIKDDAVFVEPSKYMISHLQEKLRDIFVIPEECNIEAYKVHAVREK